jgi:uracil-DNA glycosylase family 4
MMNDLSLKLLHEMGIGPLWKLRHEVTAVDHLVPLPGQRNDVAAVIAAPVPLAEHSDVVAAVQAPVQVPEIAAVIAAPDLAPVAPVVAVAAPSAWDADEFPAVRATHPAGTVAGNGIVQTEVSKSAASPFAGVPLDPLISEVPERGASHACTCGLSARFASLPANGALARAIGQAIPVPDYLFVYAGIDVPAVPDMPAPGPIFDAASSVLFDNMLVAMGIARDGRALVIHLIDSPSTDDAIKKSSAMVSEIALCLSCLKTHLKAMQPAVIVTLGAAASGALLALDHAADSNALRGQLHHFEGIPLVLSEDPHYLLLHPLEKRKVWSELCLAMRTLAAGARK